MWTRVIGLTKILTAPGVGRALELKWACRTLGWRWHALITPVKSNEIQVYVARVLSRGKSDKNVIIVVWWMVCPWKFTDVLKRTAMLLCVFVTCAVVSQQHRKSSFARVIGARMGKTAFIAIQTERKISFLLGVRVDPAIHVFFASLAMRRH